MYSCVCKYEHMCGCFPPSQCHALFCTHLLTHNPHCRDENEIAERIFERILGSSPDNQHLVGLTGCVAVANRKHRDHVSLIEADVEERRHFQAILGDPAPAYAADEVQQRLKDNMTVKKLIVKLDSLFHDFIVLRWKPAALSCLAPLEQQSQVSK